jgi:hypothetical protein
MAKNNHRGESGIMKNGKERKMAANESIIMAKNNNIARKWRKTAMAKKQHGVRVSIAKIIWHEMKWRR